MVVLRNYEESASEELNGLYFLPSTSSSSNSSVTYVWDALKILVQQNYLGEHIIVLSESYLALLVEHKIQDKGGALDVIPSGRLVKINELVEWLGDIVDSKAKNTAVECVDEVYRPTTDFCIEFKPLEKQNDDIVDQLVVDSVTVAQHLIQYRAGALDAGLLGRVSRCNWSEISNGQLLISIPEPVLIIQTKLSVRQWRGHRGQWVADICYGWNWLNIGTFKTAEGAPVSSESVERFRGGKDLFDYPFSELFVNENRAEPTTTPRTEIQTLELSPTEEQEKPDEDFELGCSEATGIDGVEAEATGIDGVEAVGIGPWNGCDSTPIQVSQSKLKYARREYGIHIWSPHPNNTPMLVDQEEIPLSNSDTLPSHQALAATVDTNSVVLKEITPPWSSPAAQQENLDEDFVNGQVEQVGSEGTEEAENAEPQLNSRPFGKRKRKGKNTRERENKKTTGVKDAAMRLNGSQSTLKHACPEHGINKWPTRNEHKHLRQSLPSKTPAVVNLEGIPQLTFDTLPFDNPLTATVNTNCVIEEVPPPQFSPAARQENPEEDFSNNEREAVGSVGTEEGEMNEAQLNFERLGNGKSNEKTPEEEKSNNKTTGVRIAIALEDILQTKEMLLKDAAKHLKVSRSKLKSSCREYGIHRWPPRDEHKFVRQSLPNEIPAIVNQDGILQLISNGVPSNQPLMATVDTNSVVKEIPAPWISPTARQENQNENFATDEIEVIGMRGVGTGEGEMEVDQLNSGCSGKRKTIEKTSRGERGNNTTGVRIAIPLEDILRTKEMRLKDAAKHLNVSRSTLKRACREYNIYRWPPREELKLLSQNFLPNKSLTVVDQGQIPQLNDDTLLPSNQVPTTMNTNSTVTVKARCGKETIKFRLSWPWGTVELKQQVKKRLELEDGTYYIRYKDEDDELILIACDDDLQDCISSSSPLGSKSIEILLEPK